MIGELPPIVLATLRKKMIALSTEIARHNLREWLALPYGDFPGRGADGKAER